MHATSFLPGLSPVKGKPLTATFDAGRLSSDGGVIVLREIAMRLGLAEAIKGPLADRRDPARVRHGLAVDRVQWRHLRSRPVDRDCVCSLVRAVLFLEPMLLTSSKSFAKATLSNWGGLGSRLIVRQHP
jgi:hypothetical protein